jgi:hypothetical protein
MRIPSLALTPQAPITGPERISASSILTMIALRGAYHLELGPVQSRVLGSVVLVARARRILWGFDFGGYTNPWIGMKRIRGKK